jgi:polyphosphate kinase 2 (PPK2 family)
MRKTTKTTAHKNRVRSEQVDSFDEELEMELDDERLKYLLDESSNPPGSDTLDRGLYFKELFRLQGELVKLQDWVVQKKLKVVVIFEGRDSAGKGGAIKRRTRACAASPHFRRRTSESERSGTSSAT